MRDSQLRPSFFYVNQYPTGDYHAIYFRFYFDEFNNMHITSNQQDIYGKVLDYGMQSALYVWSPDEGDNWYTAHDYVHSKQGQDKAYLANVKPLTLPIHNGQPGVVAMGRSEHGVPAFTCKDMDVSPNTDPYSQGGWWWGFYSGSVYGSVVNGLPTVTVIKHDRIGPGPGGNRGLNVYRSQYDGKKWTIPEAVTAVSQEHNIQGNPGTVAERDQYNPVTFGWFPDSNGSITHAVNNRLRRSHDGGITWQMYQPQNKDVIIDNQSTGYFNAAMVDHLYSYMAWETNPNISRYRFRLWGSAYAVPDERYKFPVSWTGRNFDGKVVPVDLMTSKFYNIEWYRNALVQANYTPETWNTMAAAYTAYSGNKSEAN